MASSKEDKRRKALQERRLARELQVEQSLHIWEKEILPDWKIVHRNPAMRKLWWAGIPTKLRSTMWERAVGNGLALSKGIDATQLLHAVTTYKSCW
jgi:TBC1 domain family member 14